MIKLTKILDIIEKDSKITICDTTGNIIFDGICKKLPRELCKNAVVSNMEYSNIGMEYIITVVYI